MWLLQVKTQEKQCSTLQLSPLLGQSRRTHEEMTEMQQQPWWSSYSIWTDVWEGHPAHSGLPEWETDLCGIKSLRLGGCFSLQYSPLINVLPRTIRWDKKSLTLEKWKGLYGLIIDSPSTDKSPKGKNNFSLCFFPPESTPATPTRPRMRGCDSCCLPHMPGVLGPQIPPGIPVSVYSYLFSSKFVEAILGFAKWKFVTKKWR